MHSEQKFASAFFQSRTLFVLLLAAFVYLGYGVMVNVGSLYTYKQEEASLKLSIAEKEQERISLNEVFASMGSDEVTENIARSKLGWTKEGETTVVFTTEGGKKEADNNRDKESNVKKWLSYFFTRSR